MLTVRDTTVRHFTHPSHPLQYVTWNTQFRCDGCKLLGYGNRYRCDTCDFDLHEYCCTCPTSLTSFLHPTHQLTREVMNPQGQRDMEHKCNVCRMFVNGLFYRCRECDFDVHPLCAQLPQHTRHPQHAHHVLRLQAGPSVASCVVCAEPLSNALGYRCETSDLGFHLKCFNSTLRPGPVYTHSSSVLRPSSVLSLAAFANNLFNMYQNIISGGDDGGDLNSLISWAVSTWLNG